LQNDGALNFVHFFLDHPVLSSTSCRGETLCIRRIHGTSITRNHGILSHYLTVHSCIIGLHVSLLNQHIPWL